MDKIVDKNVVQELQEHHEEEGSEGTTDGWNKLQQMVSKQLINLMHAVINVCIQL